MSKTIPFTAILLAATCLLTSSVFANDSTTEPTEPASSTAIAIAPHCEVPCGIYADQARFQQMLEDTTTIAKAITSINEFVNSMEGRPTAKGLNQMTRWVTTKENHATNVQHIVSQYFLTQRIKADKERYVDQLKAAHAVIVAAMKCKQDADEKTAVALEKAIFDLYRAYEGKEPDFHKHDEKAKG